MIFSNLLITNDFNKDTIKLFNINERFQVIKRKREKRKKSPAVLKRRKKTMIHESPLSTKSLGKLFKAIR